MGRDSLRKTYAKFLRSHAVPRIRDWQTAEDYISEQEMIKEIADYLENNS